jgi:hypothetical protein
MARLVWPIYGDVKICRLGLGQRRELDIQASEVGAGNFLVELLGEHVHPQGELFWCRPKGDLGQNLIGERARHNKRGVASGTATWVPPR